ncbi:MAG: hypothetical protein ACYC0B_04520 [Gemmatimonadaceae bacterium]
MMFSPFGSALFWIAAAAVVIAQVMILRSTRRAFRAGALEAPVGPGDKIEPVRRRSQAVEWAFAVGPAIIIAFLLFSTWQAASRAPVIHVDILEPPAVSEAGPTP